MRIGIKSFTVVAACGKVLRPIQKLFRRANTARRQEVVTDSKAPHKSSDVVLKVDSEESDSAVRVRDDELSRDFCEFVMDRLSELSIGETSTENEKWAVSVVDFFDELRGCAKEWIDSEAVCAKEIQRLLQSFIGYSGYSLIDLDKWDPDLQRAVAVEPDDAANEPIIIEKGATGLSKNGKIIRKQEVRIKRSALN